MFKINVPDQMVSLLDLAKKQKFGEIDVAVQIKQYKVVFILQTVRSNATKGIDILSRNNITAQHIYKRLYSTFPFQGFTFHLVIKKYNFPACIF